jgi:hypothetical protein
VTYESKRPRKLWDLRVGKNKEKASCILLIIEIIAYSNMSLRLGKFPVKARAVPKLKFVNARAFLLKVNN